MIQIAGDRKYPVKLIKAVEEVNALQKHIMVNKILKFYASELADRLEEVRFTRVTLEATSGTPVIETERNPPRQNLREFTLLGGRRSARHGI